MSAEEVLAVIRLIQDLEPAAFSLVKALLDRLSGMSIDDIVSLTHTINTQTITEIDAELRKLPSK